MEKTGSLLNLTGTAEKKKLVMKLFFILCGSEWKMV